MDLKSLTTEQLKAMAWDMLSIIEETTPKLQAINNEIHSRKTIEPTTTETVETPTPEVTETTEEATA